MEAHFKQINGVWYIASEVPTLMPMEKLFDLCAAETAAFKQTFVDNLSQAVH